MPRRIMAPRARKFKWRYTYSEKKKAEGGVVSPQLSQFHTWHDTERRVPSESGRPLSSGSAFRYHLPTYLPTAYPQLSYLHTVDGVSRMVASPSPHSHTARRPRLATDIGLPRSAR